MHAKKLVLLALFSSLALYAQEDPRPTGEAGKIARLRDEGIFRNIRHIFFEVPQYSNKQFEAASSNAAQNVTTVEYRESQALWNWYWERKKDLACRLLATDQMRTFYDQSWTFPWSSMSPAQVFDGLMVANWNIEPSTKHIEAAVRLRQALGVLVFAPHRSRFEAFVNQHDGVFYEPDLMWYIEKLHLTYTAQHFAKVGWLSNQTRRGSKPLDAEVLVARVVLGEVYPAIAHDTGLKHEIYKLTAHFLKHNNVNGFEHVIARLHSAMRANSSVIRQFPRTAEALSRLNTLFGEVHHPLALDEVDDFIPGPSSESEIESDVSLLDEHQALPIQVLAGEQNILLREPLLMHASQQGFN